MQTNVLGRVVGYDMNGSGRPLVLIHGYPLNRMIWEAQWQGLAEHARVIAPDLSGFGESDMVPRTVEISTYADDVREFLDALGINEPAIICGLSMGGYVAMQYLLRYPDHVAGLILSNTKATADSIDGKAGRDRNIQVAQSQGVEGIVNGMLPKVLSPKTYDSNPALVAKVKGIMETATVPGIIAALGAMRDRPDATGILLEAAVPTLVIAAADDQLMTGADALTMAEASRNGVMVTIPDAGHVSPMEQPAAWNRAVMDFIAARRELD